MLILGQKSCILGPTIFKILKPNWHYSTYIQDYLYANFKAKDVKQKTFLYVMMLPLELYFRWQILNFATTVSFKLTFTLLFCTLHFQFFYFLWKPLFMSSSSKKSARSNRILQ